MRNKPIKKIVLFTLILVIGLSVLLIIKTKVRDFPTLVEAQVTTSTHNVGGTTYPRSIPRETPVTPYYDSSPASGHT